MGHEIVQLRYRRWHLFISLFLWAPLMSLLRQLQLTLMGSNVLGLPGHEGLVPVWEEGAIGRTFWVEQSRSFWGLPAQWGHALPSRDTTIPSFSRGTMAGCG